MVNRRKIRKYQRDLFVVLIIFLSTLTYAAPTVLPFFVFLNRSKQPVAGPHLYLVIVPYITYALLEFIEERQGFNLPWGFLLCGFFPGITLILTLFIPALVHYFSCGVLIAMITCLLIWIFYPKGRLKMI